MMYMNKKEQDMKELHGLLLRFITNKLRDEDEVNPALLNVARQFLKDNNINCDGPSNEGFKKLAESLPQLPQLPDWTE
jgi:hypothetical protein